MHRDVVTRAIVTLLVGLLVLPGTAHADPGSPPEILVRPDGDGVLVVGAGLLRGRTARLEVHRGGTITGSVNEPFAGDSLVVNGPGGWCWGSGTGLAVTPDLAPGDSVELAVDGLPVARTTVASGSADPWPVLDGTTVTFRALVPPGTDPALVEHHVGAARLAATDLARRDVVARPGPPTRAPSGGYSSGLVVGGGTAVATYVADRPESAVALATAGGSRWLVRAAGDSGPTVLDGAPDGPASAACPAGPDVLTPAPPHSVVARRSPDRTAVEVSWTPAPPVPGDVPVGAWEVRAVGPGRSGDQLLVATRTPGVATTAALAGLDPTTDYTVEVRAATGPSLGAPMTVGADAPAAGMRVDDTAAPPPPAAAVDGVGLRLAARQGTQVYYTSDGTSPRAGDAPSPRAQLYTGLVLVRAPDTELSWVAVDDLTGAVGDEGRARIDPPAERRRR